MGVGEIISTASATVSRFADTEVVLSCITSLVCEADPTCLCFTSITGPSCRSSAFRSSPVLSSKPSLLFRHPLRRRESCIPERSIEIVRGMSFWALIPGAVDVMPCCVGCCSGASSASLSISWNQDKVVRRKRICPSGDVLNCTDLRYVLYGWRYGLGSLAGHSRLPCELTYTVNQDQAGG